MQEENRVFDCVVIGGGAAGIMASISAAKENKTVLLLEKLSKVAAKLKQQVVGNVILQILYQMMNL